MSWRRPLHSIPQAHVKLIPLVWLVVLSACAGTRVVDSGSESVCSRAVPTSKVYSVQDSNLVDLVLRFLATSKVNDPAVYSRLRESLQTELADYFVSNGLAESMFEIERDGMTFLLPIRLITADAPPDTLTQANTFDVQVKSALAHTRGEILDLVQLPDDGQAARLLALFADSLVTMTVSPVHPPALKTSHFNSPVRLHRPIHPSGILAVRNPDHKRGSKVIIQTSNLEAPLVFEPRVGAVRGVRSSDLSLAAEDPATWLFQKGSAIVASRRGTLGSFRSLRPLPKRDQFVMLNSEGYLKLLDSEYRPIWTSERPWGSRMFLVDDLVTVCDGRQNFFVGFEVEKDGLKLLGRSPSFEGSVTAVTTVRYGNHNGLFVSASQRDADGFTTSHLHFFGSEDFSWRVTADLPEPNFPDPDRQLTFVTKSTSANNSGMEKPALPMTLQSNIVETLFRIGNGGRLLPVLAQTAHSDKSGRILEIGLKENVYFADGTALTTEDVVNSWQQNWLRCQQVKCPHRWLWQNVVGANEFVSGETESIQGIEILDARTLRVTLKEPRQTFGEHLAQSCFVVKKHSDQSDLPVGTGPYQIQQAPSEGDSHHLRLSQNELYHGGLPLLSAIDVRVEPRHGADALLSQSSVAALVSTKRDLDFYNQVSHLRLQAFPQSSVYFVAFNPFKRDLSDQNERQQILAAIAERELLARIITEAECTPAETFLRLQSLPPGQRFSSTGTNVSRPLSIAYRAEDLVATEIAERLTARLSQVTSLDHVTLPMSEESFNAFRRGSTYDILVDSLTPHFLTPIYDLGHLVNQGYPLEADLLQQVSVALKQASLEDALELERLLIQRALLCPLLSTRNYVVLPRDLQDAYVLGDVQLDLSQAWLPHK